MREKVRDKGYSEMFLSLENFSSTRSAFSFTEEKYFAKLILSLFHYMLRLDVTPKRQSEDRLQSKRNLR